MNRVELRERILAANDAEAAVLREGFQAAQVLVLDVVSSPGAGKTSLLEATTQALAGSMRLGCLVGDIVGELDAQRLRSAGLPTHQIATGGACHLDARLVSAGLEQAGFGELDLLFIENVGNLVCPASYDLGEDAKVALLSVSEGADKPFKYPAIFARAEVTVFTKMDLLPMVDFDVDRAREQVHALNPAARVLELSVNTGRGMEAWCALLKTMLTERRLRASTR